MYGIMVELRKRRFGVFNFSGYILTPHPSPAWRGAGGEEVNPWAISSVTERKSEHIQ